MFRALKILVNSNIYISLAAVFFTIETQIQLGMKPQWHPYLFIIFFATLFEYNLHRLITVITNKEALNDEKHSWIKKSPLKFYLLVSFSVLGFLISVAFAKKEVLLTLAPLALITILYSLPILKRKLYPFRLREIPFIKIFLISFVWSAVTVILPIIQSEVIYNINHLILIVVERFLFVFAITIPFDIRDISTDKKSGLTTIPTFIGIKNAILLSNFLIILFIILCVFHYISNNSGFILIAMLISGFTTMYFINSKNLQNFRFYHYAILDGTIMLQGIMVYFFYYLETWF